MTLLQSILSAYNFTLSLSSSQICFPTMYALLSVRLNLSESHSILVESQYRWKLSQKRPRTSDNKPIQCDI